MGCNESVQVSTSVDVRGDPMAYAFVARRRTREEQIAHGQPGGRVTRMYHVDGGDTPSGTLLIHIVLREPARVTHLGSSQESKNKRLTVHLNRMARGVR